MRRSRTSIFLALALVSACARDAAREAEAPALDAAASLPRSPHLPALRISPLAGKPGAEVLVAMNGLAIGQKVDLGFGTFAGHTILESGEPTVNGDYAPAVKIPADAALGTNFFFLAAQTDARPISAPAAFLVTAPDGTVRLNGRITDGVECTALLDATETLYTLIGVDDVPEKGTAVIIEGTLAEQSICQQGLTVVVTSLRMGS
ncbi:MAG: hypothetical protein EXR95_00545 [Gemmatimonadetes bacterium]|nr:hypothetical protein [Gemmatimonadota bacterium]